MNDLEDVNWFVLRVRFQRVEKAARERLNKSDIEVYLPMEIRTVPTKCGGECVKQVPIMSDLIFVKTSFHRVHDLCAAYKDMFYQSETIDGGKRAIRIPDNQMAQFKEFISGNYDNIDCKVTKLKRSEKIVVKSGTFKGSKIIFKEERGKTTKEYIIEINGCNWNFSESSIKTNILTKI
ncbi:MAG: transcription termination/antitermination NusG family protein [Rikenellaceae bacterium]